MSFPVSMTTMPDPFAPRYNSGQNNLDRSMSMPAAGHSGTAANESNFGSTAGHSLLHDGLSNLPWTSTSVLESHHDIVEREVVPTPVSLRRGFRNRSLVANITMQQRTGNN
jgi:hypothetical protein